MPTVVYVGNVGLGSPEFSTENDVRRAFEALGWTVQPIPEKDFMRAIQRNSSWTVLRDQFIAADLVLHTMTQGSYPAVDEVLGLWQSCRNAGVPTASIHLDLFYGLSSPKDTGPQRFMLPALHPMFRVDHVFTADGDHDAEFARDGVNHHWLPPAVCHEEAIDAEPDPKWAGIEVAFVGARGYHPEHPRDKLVDHLANRFGDSYTRVAGDTEWGTVRGLELNRLYASVPVFVGDSCFADRSVRYTSDRFFETYGRGGFLVYPRIPWLVETFGDYPTWEPYEDFDAMTAAVDYWLEHPELREVWRLHIAKIVRADHSYLNRVQTMLDVMGLATPVLTPPVVPKRWMGEALPGLREELLEMAVTAEDFAAKLRIRAGELA